MKAKKSMSKVKTSKASMGSKKGAKGFSANKFAKAQKKVFGIK